MTKCLLSFLVSFLIGLGFGDSHLVILFLFSLSLFFLLISVFSFCFYSSIFSCTFGMLVLLCILQFVEYTCFLPIKIYLYVYIYIYLLIEHTKFEDGLEHQQQVHIFTW